MATPITEYVSNLIAGRKSITDLYYAVDRAREQRNNGKGYSYKASFRGIGNKVYKSNELLQLENLAQCSSMSSLLAQISGVPTIDQYVLVLLKARNTLLNLYQTFYRALYIRSVGKIFVYTFVNPFGSAAGVNRSKLSFYNVYTFLALFDNCEKKPFDALLVLNGLLLQELIVV